MKKVAILQSNYIPWKGYFDLIAAVDEFIIFDDMQYTRRDWRNRNLIKTPSGPKWMTVPVKVKGRYDQTIRETEIDGERWVKDHWGTLVHCYKKAPCFSEVAPWLEQLYIDAARYVYLTELNAALMKSICTYVGIDTALTYSWDYGVVGGKTERLVNLCIQAGGREYISGPSAQDYVDEKAFQEAGIKLTWFEYGGYPEYPQLWGEFTHNVTMLDLLFNCGRQSRSYMKYVGA